MVLFSAVTDMKLKFFIAYKYNEIIQYCQDQIGSAALFRANSGRFIRLAPRSPAVLTGIWRKVR